MLRRLIIPLSLSLAALSGCVAYEVPAYGGGGVSATYVAPYAYAPAPYYAPAPRYGGYRARSYGYGPRGGHHGYRGGYDR